MNYTQFRIDNPEAFDLSKQATSYLEERLDNDQAKKLLHENVKRLSKLHDRMWAEDHYSILVIFQSMDAAGKDGAIRHVMSGFKPQGTKVYNFEKPTYAEYDHDYLWRATMQLPRRGHIGIFNRSYYEEVLVARVHNLHKKQRLPSVWVNNNIWQMRYRQIRDYERHLHENGTIIIKIFLHVSKEEQKNRLLQRIDDKSKNWKFQKADIRDRNYWNLYQKYYNESMKATTAKHAPWYVVPADNKKIARYIVSEILFQTMNKYNFNYPQTDPMKLSELEACRKMLTGEK